MFHNSQIICWKVSVEVYMYDSECDLIYCLFDCSGVQVYNFILQAVVMVT